MIMRFFEPVFAALWKKLVTWLWHPDPYDHERRRADLRPRPRESDLHLPLPEADERADRNALGPADGERDPL